MKGKQENVFDPLNSKVVLGFNTFLASLAYFREANKRLPTRKRKNGYEKKIFLKTREKNEEVCIGRNGEFKQRQRSRRRRRRRRRSKRNNETPKESRRFLLRKDATTTIRNEKF